MPKPKIKIEEIEIINDESLSLTGLWEKWLNFLDLSMKFQKNEKTKIKENKEIQT